MGWLDGHQLGAEAPELLRASATLGWGGAAIVLCALGWARRSPLALAGAIGALCAIPSRDTAGASAAMLIATIGWVGLSAAPIEVRAFRRMRVGYLRGRRAPDLAIAISVALACAALSWILFDATPVIQDSQAQVLHARILASGRLFAPAPPSPEHFLADHVITSPAFYSQYPPGHIAVLAIAAVAPWIANPVLGGLAILAIGGLARELHGERTARRAILMAALSPFVLLMSSEAMSHASGIVCFAFLAWALARWRRTGSIRDALLAGIAAGALVLVRPLTALGLGAPLAIVALGSARGRIASLALMAIAAIAVSSLLLAWNAATNGSPWLMGYTVRWGPSHSLGFGMAPWGAPHTPARGIEHTLSRLSAWSLFLQGGPVPALALVVLGMIRDRRDALARALIAAPIGVLAIHFFYFFQDLTFGPRYLYEASAGAFVLAARGLPWIRRLAPRLPVARGVTVALLLSWALFWPPLIHEYYSGFCPRGGIVDRARHAIGSGKALVFVDGAYERAFFAVDPDLAAPILFARDLGDERNDALRCAMPEREAWLERRGELRRLAPIACER